MSNALSADNSFVLPYTETCISLNLNEGLTMYSVYTYQ